MTYSARAVPGSAFISCIFFRPLLVTNRRRAFESCGRTLLNWPTTCLSMLGGASCNRGSRAGRWTHFCRMFLSAFFACQTNDRHSCDSQRGKADQRHNTDLHFDIPLKTNQIVILHDFCAFTEIRKPPLVGSISGMIVTAKDCVFFFIATLYKKSKCKIDSSKRLTCPFVFSGQCASVFRGEVVRFQRRRVRHNSHHVALSANAQLSALLYTLLAAHVIKCTLTSQI